MKKIFRKTPNAKETAETYRRTKIVPYGEEYENEGAIIHCDKIERRKDALVNSCHKKQRIMKKTGIDKKIILYTLCYNEEKVIPFAIQYWKRIVDKVIVYDNGSTDNSIELLSNEGDFIEIRHFDYKDGINDFQLQNMKNNIWKEARYQADYVIICDMDEMFYVEDIKSFLTYMSDNEITICKPQGYEIITYNDVSVNENYLLHEQVKNGCRNKRMDKCVFFDPNQIAEINYGMGAHSCKPTGNVKYYDKGDIFLLHCKNLTLEYLLNRYDKLHKRLSQINIDNGYGKQYLQDMNQIKLSFANTYNGSVDISELPYIKRIKRMSIKWDEPTYIDNSNRNYECIVIIPYYNPNLNRDERASLRQVIKILGKKYTLCLLMPKNLDENEVCEKFKYKFTALKLNPEFFKSKWTYNNLCENENFYKFFEKYRYMLIYQLDAFVFSDRLKYFIDLDFDYYGAPHLPEDCDKEEKKSIKWEIGNGGFSLRKIKNFIDACHYNKCPDDVYEDIMFTRYLGFHFNLPPLEIGFDFSIQERKEENIAKLGHLPFGCHYFFWDRFWEKQYNMKDLYEKE